MNSIFRDGLVEALTNQTDRDVALIARRIEFVHRRKPYRDPSRVLIHAVRRAAREGRDPRSGPSNPAKPLPRFASHEAREHDAKARVRLWRQVARGDLTPADLAYELSLLGGNPREIDLLRALGDRWAI